MRPLRIFYAAGPGHVIGTFIHWKSGQDEPFEPAVPYSAQFYGVCRKLNARGYIITACPQRGFLREGLFRLEHRPYKLRGASGLPFHLGQIWNGLRLITSAVRFRADVAIIAEGSHWFLFSLLALAGVRVVPSLQGRLYDDSRQIGLLHRIINRLNARFFTQSCFAVLAMSHDLKHQLAKLTEGRSCATVDFIPLYREDTFGRIEPPTHGKRPFRVLYVGRIEENKGVFDLLDTASRLMRQGYRDIRFDVCGEGTALAQLRRAAADSPIADTFHCHGHCDRLRIREMYADAHVVIAPTRAVIGEGFNKVVVEAILSGRPVIASSVCPALAYVGQAAIAVPPGRLGDYESAIIRLFQDRDAYERICMATVDVREQFFNARRSFAAALHRVLTAVTEEASLESYNSTASSLSRKPTRCAQKKPSSHSSPPHV